MAIIATGSKTIIDLSDGKSLSCYLGSNMPRTQIYDSNERTYTPDWASANLVVTPVVYADQTNIELTDTHLAITWKRKDGSGSEANLVTGETVSGNVLTVNANKLADSTSKLITYVAHVVYTDPQTAIAINAQADISFALVSTGVNGTNGTNAKSASITGEQVFKYAAGSDTPTPTQIELTATLQNVTLTKWQYKNSSGGWSDYPANDGNLTASSSTWYVKPTHAVFNDNVATIRVVTSDNDITDVISVYKVRDGASGEDGDDGKSPSTVLLTNENVTFSADKDGKVSAVTATCNVVAYTGITKVTPTVGTPVATVGDTNTAPDGMAVTKGNVANNEVPITITLTAGKTLGGTSGKITVPVTAPVNTTLTIFWSKVNTGATGADGKNAVIFSLYAPDGTVFVNQEGTKTIQTQAYDGPNIISSGATYKWYKYASGSWTVISGQTGSSLVVSGSSVVGQASFKCEMTYGGTVYTDIITMIDKTDNYQLVVDSTAGDVFKNTIGETCLIAHLWQNGTETDGLKSTTFSETAPASPTTGQFYYKITKTTPATKLMRYSGSAWEDMTSNDTYKHTKTYKWYRRDMNGDPMDSGAVFATGKVIYIDGDDVTTKTVFVCEVE